METKKDVSYLGKDFGQFKRNLLDFAKQYFPTTYTDFNEASPGSLFIEMSAYVGDVLSYYADSNLRESLLEQAVERGNIYDLSKALGYQPLNAVPAYTDLDVFQVVPSTGTGAAVQPDWRYASTIKTGMRIKQRSGNAVFRTLDSIDFAFSSSIDPTEVTIYESDPTTLLPTYYLLKKTVRSVSGEIKTATFTFGAPIAYDKIVLPESNIIEVISITESDSDAWYETPFLAQDTVFESISNTVENDPELAPYRAGSPSLLKLRKSAKRFITRLRSDNRLEIQFGAGISDNNDEEIVPNPTNVGNGLANLRRGVDINIDPSNFLYTRTYGQAPGNTTLTVTYTVGNGISDNVPAGTLTQINYIEFESDINQAVNAGVRNFVQNTIAVMNPNPASGAKTADTVQDIKNNAMAYFATQNRLVTREDYIVRCYSMPAKYGSVAKAYIVADDQIAQESYQDKRIPNPLAMNLYVLGYNQSKQLVNLNKAVKENLKTYLDYYRIVTDAVNIKDAFIINIGVDFEITILAKYNSPEVLFQCIEVLKQYFELDRWQINQTIVKSDVINTLGNVKGVQSVVNVTFSNKYDTDFGYSGNTYDLRTATKNGVVYPSLDPSIFEVRFPNTDIRGRVVNY